MLEVVELVGLLDVEQVPRLSQDDDPGIRDAAQRLVVAGRRQSGAITRKSLASGPMLNSQHSRHGRELGTAVAMTPPKAA